MGQVTWQKELKANVVEVSFPASYEVVLSGSYVGYRGALLFMEKIFSHCHKWERVKREQYGLMVVRNKPSWITCLFRIPALTWVSEKPISMK